MRSRKPELTRCERIAWARALGRSLNEADRAVLRTRVPRGPDGEDPAHRIAAAVRRLTHGDPEVATGAERRALFGELMARRGPPRGEGRGRLIAGWAGAVAAAAVVVLLLVPWGGPQPERVETREHVAVRGGPDALPVAGLGISGVDPAGAEYEVVHGDGLCATDALRFYLTVRDARTPYYAIFGIQEPGDPAWYLPAPGDGAAPALPEVPARAWMAPFEILADGTHGPGSLSVVCILSEEPIRFPALEAAWRDADGDDIPTRAADAAAALTDGAFRVLVDEIEILEDCGRRP